MTQLTRNICIVVVLGFLVLFLSPPVFYYGSFCIPYKTKGVISTLMLANGKAYFLQPDNRLTILRIEDGSVVTQNAVLDFSPAFGGTSLLEGTQFLTAGNGVFAYNALGVSRIDGKTDTVSWKKHSQPRLHCGTVWLCGTDNITAIDQESGDELWSMTLPEARLSAWGDRIFALRSSETDPAENFLACIDSATGAVLWRKEQPGDEFWNKGGCDDKGVYVVSAKYRGKTPRAGDCTFVDSIRAWSHDGGERPNIPPAQNIAGERVREVATTPLVVDNAVVSEQEFKPFSFRDSLLSRFNEPEKFVATALPPIDKWSDIRGYHLDGKKATLLLERTKVWTEESRLTKWRIWLGRRLARENAKIHFSDGETSWSGTPGYFTGMGGKCNELAGAACNEEVVLIATQFGQVECLERESGRSRWLYQFTPEVVSVTKARHFSPPPLRYVTQNISFRRLIIFFRFLFTSHTTGYFLETMRYAENLAKGNGLAGMVIDGDSKPAPFTVVLDRLPDDTSSDHIVWYMAALGCMIVFGAGALMELRRMFRIAHDGEPTALVRPSRRAVVYWFLAMGIALAANYRFGVFSFYSTLAMKVFIATHIVFPLVCWPRKKVKIVGSP